MPEQTQKTLAQRVRAKYPGAYDDLSDVELEQKIIAKFPEYRDLPRTQEQPLTLERGQPSTTMNEHPHAKFGRLVKDNLPTIGGVVGGLAAAPFTGGMSAIPALALAAGGAALGGAAGSVGRAGLNSALDVPDNVNSGGELLSDAAWEGAIQGGSQALGGALSKGVGLGLKKGGEALYGLALRPEMGALAAKFPGVTRQGLAQTGIQSAVPVTEAGAARATGLVSAGEAAVDDALAALPKGTKLPMKPVIQAAKPVVKEAQARAAGNASVKPVFKQVKNAAASHGDQISPQEMLALQRATARQAGSAAGVMPQAARPAVNNMQPGLMQEANRAMAGGAQDVLEAAAPSIAPIQAQLPTQNALAQAIQAATQRPLLSQYMMTGAAIGAGGAAGFGAGGNLESSLGGALSAAALTNPRTLSNLAILAGRGGGSMAGGLGQIPSNVFRGAADLAQQPPDFSGALEVPPPTPLDPTTGMRLIPKEDYWTPR
jgi:hypothetical protein